MIKAILFQVKYTFSQMPFKRRKDIEQDLKASFGKSKDDYYDFEKIEQYFRKKDNSKAHQIVSDKTCNDLDFDDLFMFVDRTHSKIGQQYLYNNLRTIKANQEKNELNEDILDKLSTDTQFRVSLQKKIKKLNHKDAYFITTLFQDVHLKPPKWFFVIKLLSFISLISLFLGFFNPIFFIILLIVFCINFVIHFWNKKNVIQYINSIPQLIRLNNLASFLFKNSLLKKLNPELSKSINVIRKVKNKMTFFQLEAKFQGEFQIIIWFLFEIFKTMFLLEPLLLFSVLKKLDTKRNEIESVFEFVGHIDMLISIASLRKGLDTFCLPSITNKSKIITQELSHPLIPQCTTNSINISDKSILLTGSNMSGKTSFIRAIGLNVITGLTINTCFAKSMTMPLLKVFSAIRISDDLMNDKSYYFEEVLTIKNILKESQNGHKNLFLLDELFKGTNTIERISAGKSVLSALTRNNNKVLVSTHDIELTDMLSREYELYHFSETVNANNVGFDYKLKKGKLKNRNALRLLEINDYPKDVVKEAHKISKELDKVNLKESNDN